MRLVWPSLQIVLGTEDEGLVLCRWSVLAVSSSVLLSVAVRELELVMGALFSVVLGGA